jgi:23S rRNA pseudouridine2605 synthase
MNRKPDETDKERIAKVMARAGLCSRREAETWIAAGRVSVNGETLTTPAFTVSENDEILVDGKPLPVRERTRLFLYHKPRGLVTTNRDERERKTVFDALPKHLPRVVSVGRLDLNSEGLLLLTNDGGLARMLELPETGWQRRYRVRANGRVTQEKLDTLAKGITVDGIEYGPIKAVLDRAPGTNVWITMTLREGKNREVRNVLRAIDLIVNRLIRVSYGPFQLGELEMGKIEEVHTNVLQRELGEKIVRLSGADFSAPIRIREMEPEPKAPKKFFKKKPLRAEFTPRDEKRGSDQRGRDVGRKFGAAKFSRDKSGPRKRPR